LEIATVSRFSRRFLVCAAALLAVAASLAFGEEGRLLVRNFEPHETGGAPFYWNTVQDERGILYFGCSTVVSFDGTHWRQYPIPGAHAVRCLDVAPSGRVWVGAINEIGYFDREPTGNLSTYHSLVSRLPAGTSNLGDVWSVFARENGAVFVTSHSILVWDGASFRIEQLPGGRRLLATKAEGKIYISNLLRGILVLEDGELKPLAPASLVRNSGWFWLERSDDGWLVVSSQGLARYSEGHFEIIASAATSFIQQHIVSSATRLPNGSIGVSTMDAGLAVITSGGDIERVITQEDGLLTNNIESVSSARDGTVWILSDLGASRTMLDSGVSFFGPDEGLAAKGIYSMMESGGQLLVSSPGGAFALPIGPDSNSRFQPFAGLGSLQCRDMAASGDSVYAAGYKRIDRLEGGHSSLAFTADDEVLMLRPSKIRPGTFLAADGPDLLRLTPDSSGDLKATKLARLPDAAISVAEDARGTVWAGTSSRGVFQLPAAGAGSPIPLRDADGHAYAGRGVVARVGPEIAVSTERGLMLFSDASSAGIPVPAAPGAAAIDISNADPDGRVWIAFPGPFSDGEHVTTIGRLSVDAHGAGQWTPFAIPGLPAIGDVSRLYVDHRGILWIGGSSGLLRVETGKLEPVGTPHAPVIHATVAAGGRLPWSRNSATLDFGSVEFSRPESVRFQTRLLPGSPEWSDPTATGHLVLAGLRDADYQFEVRTINDAGFTSAPATWRFAVLPPWYRTNVAYTAWALLLAGACVGFVQWRSAYLRQRNLKLEELVRKKTEQLEKANAAKSEFLANMSHEIRNPISGIVGLSIAMEETPLDTRQQRLVDSIQSCASLLATLVDDVLDFSKIEAGKIDLHPAPFDLRASLEQCIAMVVEEVNDTGGSISLAIAPDVPPRVVGDAGRIQQIVVNYLTNALKFSPGQPIVVGAEPATPGCVRFYVKDRGPGMTQADAATLFTKFTRLEPALRGNIRGTGLGLAVCRLLATRMGGTVGVSSRLREGSRFWVELPLPVATDTPAQAEPAPAPAVTLRALIVEDIDYNGIAMQAVLRKLGIDSEIVTDGPSALTRLLNSRFDVVFMDWNLPGMVGTEVVSRFRSLEPAGRRTIIIATTAYSEDFNREACLAAGMDAFISKPFTPEKIAAALADLRESRRAAASVVVPAAEPASPMIHSLDLQFLLFAGQDSPESLRNVIDRYLSTFAADLAAARDALDRNAPGTLPVIAHRIVNHARMVKAGMILDLAVRLESDGTLVVSEKLHLLDEIEREFALVRDTLASIRASAQPA
jgi:signal transduction histidine kinase/CheY-like chemotaxis protein